MSTHAKLSPSGGDKWMTCPGSIHLEALVPFESSGSSHANRGTAIHEISENALKKNIDPSFYLGKEVFGIEITQDDIDISNVYVTYVRDAVGTKLIEKRVSLEYLIPDCFGTVDAVVMREGHLIIIDLKTGAGIPVFAEENKQLQIYALGAFNEFDWVYDFKKVTLVIVQPPLQNISVWSMEPEQLVDFGKKLQVAYQLIQDEPTTYIVSEKGCRWCRGKAICPEQKRIAKEAAAKDYENMSAHDVAESLELVPLLKSFIDAVEGYAKESIMSGKEIPGYKLVEGRRTRDWKDETHFIKWAEKSQLTDKIYSQPKLLSVAQAEKIFKGSEVDISEFIEVKTGAPTLAKNDDKREALNSGNKAKKDFANLNE
jgi:hypothetical protein